MPKIEVKYLSGMNVSKVGTLIDDSDCEWQEGLCFNEEGAAESDGWAVPIVTNLDVGCMGTWVDSSQEDHIVAIAKSGTDDGWYFYKDWIKEMPANPWWPSLRSFLSYRGTLFVVGADSTSTMKKVHKRQGTGSVVTNWGATKQELFSQAVTVATSATAGGLYGSSYQWIVTYQNELGHESVPSDASGSHGSIANPLIAASANVTFPNPGDPVHWTKVLIYRRGGSLGDYYYVDSVASTGTATQTYTDVKSDAALGAKLSSTDNAKPPISLVGAFWLNRCWLGGVSGDAWKLIFSKPYDPESFPAQNYFYLSDGTEIMSGGLHVYGNNLHILTNKRIYIVLGTNETNFEIRPVQNTIGCRERKTVAVTEYGIMYVSVNGSICLFDGNQTQDISTPKIRDFFSRYLTSNYVDMAVTAWHKKKFYVSLPTTMGIVGANNKILIADFNTGNIQWHLSDLDDFDILYSRAQGVTAEGKLYGSAGNVVYELESSIAPSFNRIGKTHLPSNDVYCRWNDLTVDFNTQGQPVNVGIETDDGTRHIYNVATTHKNIALGWNMSQIGQTYMREKLRIMFPPNVLSRTARVFMEGSSITNKVYLYGYTLGFDYNL